MHSQLARYEQLSALHDQMADAAFALDWDKLILLERQSAEIVLVLQHSSTPIRDQEERRRIAALIQQIVEKQTRIRDEIKVWRDDATPLLATLNSNRSS